MNVVAKKQVRPGRHLTGLPFVVWLVTRPGPMVEIETSVELDGLDRTVFQITPWLRRLRGPYDWATLAMLSEFRRLNLPLIQAYWDGSLVDPRETVARIVPVSAAFVENKREQAALLAAWCATQENVIATMRTVPTEYKLFGRPLPDIVLS